MSGLDQEIGKRLRKARRLRGYKSARAFAIEKNIPESTYSQHETGKRSLGPETVLRYCEWLKVDPGWLLSGHESGSSPSSEATPPVEVSLHASNRHAIPQHNKNTSVAATDALLVINMDIFTSVLKKAIQQNIAADISADKLEQLIEDCLEAYSSIVKVSSDHQVKDGDAIMMTV